MKIPRRRRQQRLRRHADARLTLHSFRISSPRLTISYPGDFSFFFPTLFCKNVPDFPSFLSSPSPILHGEEIASRRRDRAEGEEKRADNNNPLSRGFENPQEAAKTVVEHGRDSTNYML